MLRAVRSALGGGDRWGFEALLRDVDLAATHVGGSSDGPATWRATLTE